MVNLAQVSNGPLSAQQADSYGDDESGVQDALIYRCALLWDTS
jgi:hypothetical protein